MTETELVKQVAAGAEAFSALVTLYRPALVTFCARRVGGEDAEEAAQDALLCAWQSIGKCKDLAKFKRWIWGIAKKKCNQRIRKAQACQESVQLDSVEEIVGGNAESLDGLLAQDKLKIVRANIGKLPPMQRKCILMLANKSTMKEISESLGISRGAVRWHVCMARAYLTEALANATI